MNIGRLLALKLRSACDDTPEARLMLAIWLQAARDAYATVRLPYIDQRTDTAEAAAAYQRWEARVMAREEAREFLLCDTDTLERAGVDPLYARRILQRLDARLPPGRRLL